MDQSLLIELIRTLTKEEKDLVQRLMIIPIFNNGKMKKYVPTLLNICLDHTNPTLDKSMVYTTLFPGQAFSEGRIEKIMVEAHKLIRTALLIQNWLHDENEFNQVLTYAEILRKKGLSDKFSNTVARLKKVQSEQPCRDLTYFNNQVKLDYVIHDFECINNQKKGDLYVPQLLRTMEIQYDFNRVYILNRILLQQKFSKIDHSEHLDKLINSVGIPNEYLDLSPILRANYEIFTLLRKPSPTEKDIRNLFDFLKTHEQSIDPESHQELYTYLRNLCILLLSEDLENIPLEYLLNDLYKDNLKRGFLHYEGKIHPSKYWAVSSSAIRTKDFNWAIQFIERYKDELIGENESRDIYRLNLANYYFGIGEFEKSLENIPPNSPFLDYMLTGKRLELKAYYELDSDLLPYKIDAFKVYLSRTSPKQISEGIKNQLTEFINLLAQLSISIRGDTKRSEILIRRVREKKQAAEWRWLLEKAEALKSFHPK